MILVKLFSDYLTFIQLALQKFHTSLFRKLNNKIVAKLQFISFSQYFISKLHTKLIYNRLLKKKIVSIQNKNYIIRSDISYKFSKQIIDYKIKNNVETEEFIKDLDSRSRELIKMILNRMFYIYTHSLINLEEIITRKEINMKEDINNFIFSIKKNVELPYNRYEVSIFYYDCGLKLLPSNIISNLKNKDFIDGGAFFGDSALIFERNYYPQKIYAFEPELENYNLLLNTVKRNNLKKIVPLNKAIGEKQTTMKIKSTGGSSSISKKGDLLIDVVTIDDFSVQNNLNIGLIKMDIEGYALNALKGAEKTIKIFSPILLISIYHNGEEFFESIEYIRRINPSYKFIIRKLNPSSAFLETTLIGWVE